MHLICKTTIAAALAFACCCGCQKTEKVSASAVADAATACCAGQAATCSTAQKAACTAEKAACTAEKAACTAAKAPTARDRTVRADYAATREKMKAMVANGEITEEQMEQRLNRMAVKIRGDQGDQTKVQPAAATG